MGRRRSAPNTAFNPTWMTPGGNAALPGRLVLLRASSGATVQASDRTVVTGIAANTARIGQRTALATSRGLVLEEARTNLMLQSGDPSNAAWTRNNSPTFPGTILSPDSTVVTTIQDASATLTVSVSQARGTAASYTASVWYSWLSGNFGLLETSAALTDTVGTASAIWQILTQTVTHSGVSTVLLAPATGSPPAVTGQGVSSFWGAQYELGSFRTEWIPTTAASATRAGEQLSHPVGSSYVSGGRLGIEIKLITKASRNNNSSVVRLWTVDALNYAEYNSGQGTLTIVIRGIINLTDLIEWNQFDTLEIWMEVGVLPSVVKIRFNGIVVKKLDILGPTLGSVVIPTSIDLLCNGTATQFSSWIQGITTYAFGFRPAWANDAPALFNLDIAAGYVPGGVATPSQMTFSRASGAPVQTSDTTVDTTPGVDVLRVGQFGPTAETRGFVIEESRTNLAPSRNLSSGWTAGSLSTQTGAQPGPDGQNNATRLEIVSGGFSTNFSPANVAGQYTASIFVMQGSVGALSDLVVSVNGGSSLTAGVAANSSVGAAWRRVAATPTNSNTVTTGVVSIVPSDGRNFATSPPSGLAAGARDVVADLPQLEIGAFATEPIVTAGASATRAGDRFSITDGSSIVSNGRLSFELQCIPKGARATASAGLSFILWYVDANNNAQINKTTAVLTIRINGVNNTFAGLNWPANAVLRLWIECGGSQKSILKWCLDGGVVLSPTVAELPLGNLTISGACDILNSAGTAQFSSWLQVVRTYRDGTRPAWADSPGAAFAYRADVGVTVATGVSTLANLGGTVANLVNATGAQQPTLSTLGGKPALRFQKAANQNLSRAASLAQPRTLVVISRMDAVGAAGVNDVVVGTGELLFTDTTNGSYAYANTALGPGVTELGTTPNITIVSFNGVNSRFRRWYGSVAIDVSGNAGVASTTATSIGGIGATRNTDVTIAEISWVTGVISDAYAARLVAAAYARYGL